MARICWIEMTDSEKLVYWISNLLKLADWLTYILETCWLGVTEILKNWITGLLTCWKGLTEMVDWQADILKICRLLLAYIPKSWLTDMLKLAD